MRGYKINRQQDIESRKALEKAWSEQEQKANKRVKEEKIEQRYPMLTEEQAESFGKQRTEKTGKVLFGAQDGADINDPVERITGDYERITGDKDGADKMRQERKAFLDKENKEKREKSKPAYSDEELDALAKGHKDRIAKERIAKERKENFLGRLARGLAQAESSPSGAAATEGDKESQWAREEAYHNISGLDKKNETERDIAAIKVTTDYSPAASNILQEVYRTEHAPSKDSKGSGIGKAGKAIAEKLTQEEYLTMGASLFRDAPEIKSASENYLKAFERAKKEKKGDAEAVQEALQSLNKRDLGIIQSMALLQETEQKRGGDISNWYKAGGVFAEMLPFAAQLKTALSLVRAGGKAMARATGKQVVNKTARKILTQGAQAGVNTLISPQTQKALAEEKFNANVLEARETDKKDYAKVYTLQAIENITETLGGDLAEKGLKSIVKGGKLLARQSKTGRELLGRFATENPVGWTKLVKNTFDNKVTRFLKNEGAVHSQLGESLEEVEGAGMETIFGYIYDDEQMKSAWSNFWTKDSLATMVLAFSPMTIFPMAFSVPRYITDRNNYNRYRTARQELINAMNVASENFNGRESSKVSGEDVADAVEQSMTEGKFETEGTEILYNALSSRGEAGREMLYGEAVQNYVASAIKMNKDFGALNERLRTMDKEEREEFVAKTTAYLRREAENNMLYGMLTKGLFHNMQDENGREAEYVVELNSDEGILGTVTGKREEKGETVFEFTDSFGRKGEITYGELQKMNTEGDLPLIATKTDDILNYLKGQAEGDAEMQKRIEKRRSWINSAQRDEEGRLYVETGTVNIEGEDKEVLIKARNEETGTAIIEAEGKTVQVSTEEIRDVRRRGFEESEENVSERVVLDIADTEKEDFEGYMRNAYGKEEDKQGNPTTENGKLIIEDVKSIDEISDRDFEEPYRNVGLPVLPTEVQNVLGIKGRKVIIKKNIFERNKLRHQDLSPENSREILREALYNTDLYGQNQKKKRPYNWVVINTKDASGDNRIVLLEIREDKENVEIVHWHYLDDRSVEKIRRQAEREGGQLLILPSENTEEAGALSSRTSDLSSESKDNTKVGNSEEKRLPFENKRSLLNELPADGSTAINPTNESSRQTPDISALDNSEGKDSTKDGNGEGKRSKNIKVADEIAKLRKREEEKSIQQIQEREEISEGVFGNIYNQFKGKVKEAIDFLLNNKEGIAKEVLHHKDIKGGIDLVYGTDTYGLKKIAKKHPEVLENLQEILDNMSIVSSSDNRIVLESATHKAVISKKIGDIDTDNWLLTAYEKKKGNETSASSSDIETEPEITGKRNGTATSQNSTSSGKDSTNSGNESNEEKNNNGNNVKRKLSKEEAEDFVREMEEQAEVAQEKKLTPKNWEKEFGESGLVDTPIGKVRMGDNQYLKLARKGREGKLGMIRPTLENPDVIIEEVSQAKEDQETERTSSYIFVKSFKKKDGSRYYYFTSVTVSKDGQEVVISNQEKTEKRISKLLRESGTIWINSKFSLHPTTQIEEPVLHDDTNRLTQSGNQSAMLGIRSSELEGKDTGKNKNDKGNKKKDEYVKGDKIVLHIKKGDVETEAEYGDYNGKEFEVLGMRRGFIVVDNEGKEMIINPKKKGISIKKTAGAENETAKGEERDENGIPFVKASDGTTIFGEIKQETGLAPAPIRLSEGINYKNNQGYGLKHIKAKHGEQILNAGYETVEEFIEDVAKNFDTIKKGNTRATNETYLLEITDKYNHTLYIELSKDGSYWNINSAGIFKKGYSKKKSVVWTLPALSRSTNTDAAGVTHGTTKGATVTSGNSPQTTDSDGKVTGKSETDKENKEKSLKERLKTGEVIEDGADKARAKFEASEKVLGRETSAGTQETTTEDKALLDAVVDKLKEAIGEENVITDNAEAQRVLEEVNGKGTQDIEAINNQFNEDFQQQIDGKLPREHTYQLGQPSNILLSAGIPNLPIELKASRLLDKSMQNEHPFDLSEIKNIVNSIHNPLVVFRSATHIGSNVILTELKHGKRSFVVAIETNRKQGKIHINSIRSIHYRTSLNLINWINNGLAEYIKPTFAEEWLNPIKTELLSQPQYNSTDVRKQLNSAAKIIQEFENPTINGEKKAKQQNREGEDEKENKVFNEELRDFKEGKLKSGRLHLGGPKGLLRSCGLNASEILLSAKTLKEHLNKHNIGVEEIKDLPKAINEPLMVYEWGTKAKSSIIITNITRENGEKITVAVKVDRDGQHLNVNKIASIHGKNSKRFISDMLSEGEHNIENSLKYVQENKKEVLDWLGMDSPKESASLTNEELRIAKVIENFDTEKFLKQNLVQEHRVYHGSGADFEAFDFSHMGEGEGAQAFGWGGYVTEVEGIGRTYAEKLRPELLGKYQENIVINKIAQQKFDSYNGDIVRAIEDFRKILNEPWCDKKRVKKAIRILESGKKLPEGRLHSTYIYTVEIPDDKEVTEKDNRNYNAQIRSYEEGLMKSNEYIRLGSPKGVIKAFMPESDIIMRRKVLTKARKKHNLLPMSLLNLPKAIAKPIFVFKSSEMTVSVLTELKDGNGKNIFVAIELNAEKQLGHEVLEVNDILTVHGRDIENIVKPIAENESLLWVDKEKGSRWLSSAKSNSQAIATETLNSAAKIIQEFENPKFYEYKVGEYLEWDKEAGERLINKVAKELDKRGVEIEYSLPEYIRGYSTADKLRYIVHNMSESNKGSVRDLYRELETILKRTEKGGDKAASKLLHDIGYIGIKYPAQYLSGGRSDGAMNYVIFDEKDLKITDKVRFFKTKSGQAYGFTVKGKVYIDTKIAGAGTPIHEYTHLWATALRQSNPKEWENIVELMKRDKYLWDKTRKMYPELQSDEEIADEVLAHYSGKRGAERLAEEVRKIKAEKGGNIFDKARALRAIQNVKEALERFWREVADFFNIHFTTAEEIADKVLSDMLNGVNPNEYIRRGGNRGNAVKNNKAYSSEEQSIIEKAKKEGTYMKAPNGKRTNLTEKQWVQVRTKAFKEWFGDWEKTARIDKLRKSKNIEATGNEYKGKYELNNKSADNYIKETLRGEYTNKDIKETIKITRIGAEKVTRHDAESEIHLKSVALIPQMLENAIFITEETNEKAKRGFDSYKYYVVGLKINGVDYTAKLVVGVKNGQTYYDHSLTEISKEKLLNERDRISTSVYQKEQSFDIDNVKDKRLLSILEGNSSKVVDENGEPMVVYHGTPIRFTVFDTPTNMPRIFTAKNVSFAEMYGEEPMALFANLRNPLEVDYKGGDAFEPIEVDGVKIEDIEELAAYARTKGYDGVVARNVKDAGTRTSKKQVSDEVIVFEPTQIKSATDNIGTFDKENNDIRFEKAEEERKRHLESVNAKFNEDLQQQIDGKLPKEHTYQLGQPSTVLKSVGIPNLPIELKASRLSSKSKQENHPFDLEDVKDLVKAIQNPLAIFEYGDKSKAQNIIVEISKGGKNFLVGLSLNPKNLQINDVRGIFPKDSSEWLNWISQGKALYLDKEKIQTLINQQRINLAEVDYLDLNSVAKIIENFENPHIEEKNSEENIRFEKEDNDIDEVNNRFSEELDNFARGEMRSSDKFHLGKPNETLRACGLNAGEIIMTQSVLQNHLKKHGLTTQEIKDLPKAINEPLMVYEWGTKAKNTVVITSIERGNERITISIRLNKNGKGIEVNEISSVHGKSMERLMNEITTEKSDFGKDNLKYVDKEKVFNWFAMETPKVSSQNNQRLNSVAKVIENFENPHIEEENSEENIRFEKIVEEETEGEEEKLSEEEIREREIDKVLEEVEDEEKKSVYREVMERIGKSKAGEKVMSFADDYHSLRVMEDKVVRTMRKRIKGFRLPFSVYEQQIASKSATEGQIILFTEQVFKPLMRKVKEIAGKYGLSEKEVEQYLMFNFYGERTDEIVFNRWAEYKRAKESGTKPNEEYRQEYEKVEEYKAMLSDEEKKACLDDTEELFEKMSGEKSYDSTEEIDKEWQRLNEEALARRGAEKYREAELWSKESGEGIKGFAGEEGMCHTALYQTMAEKYFPEAAGDMDKTRLSPKVITGAFRDMAGDEECDELERLSRAVNDYSSERALEGRSISREEYERYKRQKYYVPLRGWDKDGGEVSVFGADDVFQGINPNAKGRKTTADSPLKYMFAIACGQIQRCNDNEAKRNLAEFVNRYKKIIMGEDAVGYWSWTDREGNAQKDTKKPKKKDYMEGTLVYNIMNKEYDRVFPGSMKKHLFEFKDGKRVYRIYFASTHLADVLNGKGVGLSGAVVDKVRKTTRFMASMRTSKNPAFAAANFVRDSAVVLFLDENRQEEYPNFRRTFLKNLAKMQTVNRSIFNGGKSYRGSKADNEMQKLYNQWVYFGGMSGYNFFLEDLDKEFERRYKDMNKSKVKKALGNINIGSSDFLDVFAMISEVTENQVRFAAFRTYLECSERAGNPLTIREAVYKSKEATLNFSRSGWGARTVGALFPFFNATCQGLIKLARLLRYNPYRLIRAICLFLAAGMTDAWLSMLLGGDDDKKNKYLQVNEYVQERNIIIGGVKIPIPQEMYLPFTIGVNMAKTMKGKMTGTEAKSRIINAMGELLPSEVGTSIGALVEYDRVNDRMKMTKHPFNAILSAVSPGMYQPIADYNRNRDFMDSPILPGEIKEEGYNKKTAQAGRYDEYKTYGIYQDMAFWWNNVWSMMSDGEPISWNREYYEKIVSSGNTLRKKNGEIGNLRTVSPQAIQYFVGQYAPGINNIVTKNADIFLGRKELSAENIPIIDRLAVRHTEHASLYKKSSLVYDILEQETDYKNLDKEKKEAKKYGEDVARFDKAKKSKSVKVAKRYGENRKKLQRLRTEVKLLRIDGAVKNKKKIDELLDEQEKIYDKILKDW